MKGQGEKQKILKSISFSKLLLLLYSAQYADIIILLNLSKHFWCAPRPTQPVLGACSLVCHEESAHKSGNLDR